MTVFDTCRLSPDQISAHDLDVRNTLYFTRPLFGRLLFDFVPWFRFRSAFLWAGLLPNFRSILLICATTTRLSSRCISSIYSTLFTSFFLPSSSTAAPSISILSLVSGAYFLTCIFLDLCTWLSCFLLDKWFPSYLSPKCSQILSSPPLRSVLIPLSLAFSAI